MSALINKRPMFELTLEFAIVALPFNKTLFLIFLNLMQNIRITHIRIMFHVYASTVVTHCVYQNIPLLKLFLY